MEDLSEDLLRGADEIAKFMGLKPRQIYHLNANHRVPFFKIGNAICARKSRLERWLEEQENANSGPVNDNRY